SVFCEGKTARFELIYKSSQLKHLKLEKFAHVSLLVTIFPIKDEQGNITNAVIQHNDITERKKAEEALIESEIEYKAIFENIKSAVAVYNAMDNGSNFIFKDFNHAAEEIDQIKREDVIGQKVTEVFPGVVDFGLFEVFQRVWETGIPEKFTVCVYHDDRIDGWRANYVYKLPAGRIVSVHYQ